jgi:ABC-type uncharacterized transport system permease subunit
VTRLIFFINLICSNTFKVKYLHQRYKVILQLIFSAIMKRRQSYFLWYIQNSLPLNWLIVWSRVKERSDTLSVFVDVLFIIVVSADVVVFDRFSGQQCHQYIDHWC